MRKSNLNNIEKIENIVQLIIRMFKKWVEVSKPNNLFFKTTNGDYSAEQILKQMEKGIGWGRYLKILIRDKFEPQKHFETLSKEEKESIIFSFIGKKMEEIKIPEPDD